MISDVSNVMRGPAREAITLTRAATLPADVETRYLESKSLGVRIGQTYVTINASAARIARGDTLLAHLRGELEVLEREAAATA